jgi:hypothetical protein
VRLFPVVAALIALLGGSLLMLVNAPRALACPVCIPPDKVTISDGGAIAVITDPTALGSLGAATFMGFNQPSPVAEPALTVNGYEVTRYFKNSGVPDSFWTLGFDHMRYFPGATGQPGYVFYEGPVSDEASHYAQGLDMPQSGRWYQIAPSDNDMLRQMLTTMHVSLSVKDSGAAPPPFTSVPPTATQPPAILRALASFSKPVAILLAFLGLLAAGVGYRLARNRRHPRTFTPADETAD